MAKRTGLLDDLLAISSRLPWWAGVGFAALSYLGLHHIAQQPIPAPTGVSGQVVELAKAAMINSLSSMGQYLLPGVFLVGAGISAYSSKARDQLFQSGRGDRAVEAIDGMSWREFESLVGEGYRRKGFSVKELGGEGPDGGIDLVLTKGSERHLVQCKQWRANKVGVAIVRELYGVMSAKGAAGGVVVTSGSFTSDATAFANGRNIDLVDGPKLLVLLKSAREKTALVVPSIKEEAQVKPQRLIPKCPQCESTMKLREARKGASAGKKFWGCDTYPKCRGTLPFLES